jgi:hypothetical protein
MAQMTNHYLELVYYGADGFPILELLLSYSFSGSRGINIHFVCRKL